MNHHHIKSVRAMYDAVSKGDKRFEVRFDDRAYQCGDLVTISVNEPSPSIPAPWDEPETPPLTFKVGFVLRGGQFGINDGYVVFALEDLDDAQSGLPL